jgi:hypothetical protein
MYLLNRLAGRDDDAYDLGCSWADDTWFLICLLLTRKSLSRKGTNTMLLKKPVFTYFLNRRPKPRRQTLHTLNDKPPQSSHVQQRQWEFIDVLFGGDILSCPMHSRLESVLNQFPSTVVVHMSHDMCAKINLKPGQPGRCSRG